MLYLLLIIYTPLKRAGHVTGSFILLIFFYIYQSKSISYSANGSGFE